MFYLQTWCPLKFRPTFRFAGRPCGFRDSTAINYLDSHRSVAKTKKATLRPPFSNKLDFKNAAS